MLRQLASLRMSKEEEGNLAGMEQEEVIETAQHGSGSVPANDSSANLPEGHNGSSGEQLNDVKDEISDHADSSRQAGGSGSQERAAPPPGGVATTAVVKTIEIQKPERGPS